MTRSISTSKGLETLIWFALLAPCASYIAPRLSRPVKTFGRSARCMAISTPKPDLPVSIFSGEVDCIDTPDACDVVCDKEASCDLEPTPQGRKRDRLVVRMDDEWYDLTGWRKAHPSGSHWIDLYNNADATEVMYAFHSDTARKMLPRLPKARPNEIPTGEDAPIDVSPVSRAFRALRVKLEEEGWFKRKAWPEAKNLIKWSALMGVAAAFARRNALISALMLGIANTSAGWLAHDYVHGRGKWAMTMRAFGMLGGGMSPTWWSDKHNLHHALTNVAGIDEDLMVDPFLYMWAPDPKNDSPFRKFQHLYWMLPYSMLFAIWRIDSIKVAFKRKLWGEVAGMGLHYAMLFALFPVKVLLPALFISGLLTAIIVTVSHQNEEIHMDGPHKLGYVEAQFQSTRDYICGNPVFEYMAGGMNYQLEHHLFPTMPRYYYPKLVPIIKQFAKEQGIEYKTESEFAIIGRTIDKFREVSKMEPKVGATGTKSNYVELLKVA